MSIPTMSAKRNVEILRAVRRVYEAAELDPNTLRPGIVPLYDLVGAYPIRIAELNDLTYRSAADFLMAETGQSIPVPGEDDRPLAGFLYIYEYSGIFYGCVLVRKDDPIARRRFSVAHELGHYVLHFSPLLERQDQTTTSEVLIMAEGLVYTESNQATDDLPSGQPTFTRSVAYDAYSPFGDVQQLELEANQFAAELLMPRQACEVLVEQYRRRFGNKQSVLARRLASEFLVSQTAMRRRLAELNLPDRLRGTHVGQAAE